MFKITASEGNVSMAYFKVLVVVGAMAIVFAKQISSSIGKAFDHTTATATIVDRERICRLSVRQPDKSHTYRTLACPEAYAIRKASEPGTTRVHRRTFVTVTFTLNDGRQHTARVREYKIKAHKKPIGSQVAISYNPRNPDKITRAKSWTQSIVGLLSTLFSLLILGLFFYFMFNFRRAFDELKKRIEDAAKGGPIQVKRADNTLSQGKRPSTAKPPATDTAPINAPPSTPPRTKSRDKRQRRAKVAPIPSTGGVVSKRRVWPFG